MNLLIKTTLKNIFGKPLRSLMVIFSIFVCALAAMFCFDLVQTEQGILENIFTEVSGEADVSVSTFIDEEIDLPEELPEYRALPVINFTETLYEDVEGEYYIVTTDDFTIKGVDTDLAADMGLMEHMDLGVSEIIVTDQFADEYGYKAGDNIVVHDKAGEEHIFTVLKIVKADQKKLLFRGKSAVVNKESSHILTCGKHAYGMVFLDILDDERISDAEAILDERYGDKNVVHYSMDDETRSYMSELYGLLFVVFAIAFLLVVFITASICDRIVSERMSFIGTLRSLGMSTGKTVWILLMENICYALLGSVPGVLLYIGIRPSMMNSMFNLSAEGVSIEVFIPELSVFLAIGVILGAILVECMIPMKAIMKAIRTSIRDIIFDNRDTEYRMSKSAIITGFVFLVIGVVSFFGKSMITAGICLVSCVTALACLYPLILKGIVTLVEKISDRISDAKSSLAFREVISRKSTVGSGVLCATSAAMCIIIATISGSMASIYNPDLFTCDVIVDCSDMSKYFSFVEHLEGVTDTEYVYCYPANMNIDDDTTLRAGFIYGYPEGGFKYYNGLHEMPDSLEPGTVCIEKNWAKQNGKAVGDTIKISFNPEGVFPIVKEFTVASYYKIDQFESMKNDFVMCESDFIDIFHDNPGYLLVRSDDPDTVRDEIKKYAVGRYTQVRTRQEIIDTNKKDSATSNKVLTVLISVAFLMTFIGMVSNQTIGFEGRKKECAVMLSTSMTKRTLTGILFREMFITSCISATTGAIVGALMFTVIKKAIDSSQMLALPVELDIILILKLWILMMAVFTLSVLFPVKNMRKMKLSEQLKYE